MQLTWIALEAFRSYRGFEWRPDSGVNVLVGPNGAGKTNLLEAVGYLGSLRSFRGSPDDALVGFESETGVVRGEVVDSDASSLIEVEIPRRGARRVLVNRKRLPRIADLLGHVRVVSFLPNDLDIVKRGPAYRRGFVDDTAVQLWPGSYVDQAEFERALRQRNAFLKQGADDPVTLGVWDERLAQAGARVMARRARAVAALRDHLEPAHRQVAGREAALGVAYESGWGASLDPRVTVAEHASELGRALSDHRRIDRERRVTTVGPHRDDPMILLDGHDLRYHGSQGEQRTVTLSLKLAAHQAITQFSRVTPILLLDDVYSELDPVRSSMLTAALPQAQTLVTTADPGTVPLEGRTWQVADGKVT